MPERFESGVLHKVRYIKIHLPVYSEPSRSKLSRVFTCPEIFIIIILGERSAADEYRLADVWPRQFRENAQLDVCNAIRLHNSFLLKYRYIGYNNDNK